MKRPFLNKIPIRDAMPGGEPKCIITMSPGQWDEWLDSAYQNGFYLLELNSKEEPINAYHKEVN